MAWRDTTCAGCGRALAVRAEWPSDAKAYCTTCKPGDLPLSPPMNDEGWEARMARRAATRRDALGQRQASSRHGVFARWLRPDDPDDILPEILAARCLGIQYGDPGPKLPSDRCRQCWGDRHVWLGNTWGLKHTPPGFSGCKHACHEGELWLATG